MDAQKDKHGIDRYKVVLSIIDSYMTGEPNHELDDRIRDWLSNGEARAEKERVLGEIWEKRVRPSRPDKESYRMLSDICRRLGFEDTRTRSRSFRISRSIVQVAAALAIGFIVGGAVFFATQYGNTTQDVLPERITVNASGKGMTKVKLPDGSTVWVHANSSISYYDEFATGREISLEGEAYFSVTKQLDGKPFIVESNDVSVEVLGTEFMVQADSTTTLFVVEVAKGSVEVTARQKSLVLGSHDRLVYEKSTGEFRLSEISDTDIAPWKNATLDFNAAPLEEVFHNLSMFYGVEINIEGRFSENDMITVKFSPDTSLEEALNVIALTSKVFDFEIDANGSGVDVSIR